MKPLEISRGITACLMFTLCLAHTTWPAKKQTDPAAIEAENKRLCQKLSHDGKELDMTNMCEAIETTREQLAQTDKLTPEQEKLLDRTRILKRTNSILSRVAPLAEKYAHTKSDAVATNVKRNEPQSPSDTIDTLPRTTQKNPRTRALPCAGGDPPLGSYTICEIRESFQDQQQTLASVNDKVDYLVESCCDGGGSDFSCQELIEKLDSVYDVVVDTNSKIDELNPCDCDEVRASFADVHDAVINTESRLESCCSYLEPTLSIVEDISERLPCKTCDACITQADVAGGTYTISSPGVYCVAENLTATGAHAGVPIIEITSGKTTLDLCGHTIDGGGTGGANVCVRVNHGTTGPVTVKNGHVTNAYSADTTNGAGLQVLGVTHDWRIKEIYATTNTNYGIHVYNPSLGVNGPGAIHHCITDSNGIAGVYLVGLNPVDQEVQNVDIADSLARFNGTESTEFNHAGFVSEYATRNISFRRCTAQSNIRSGFANSSTDSVIKDCLTTQNTYYGVQHNNSSKLIIKNLISQKDNVSAVDAPTGPIALADSLANADSGTAFTVGSDALVNNCIALSGGFITTNFSAIRNCITMSALQGFIVGDYCCVSNCVAHRNSTIGFGSTGKHVTLEGNTATIRTNTGAGFSFTANDSNGGSAILRNCTAQLYDDSPGSSIGFDIATTNSTGSPAVDCTLIDCVADGFEKGFSLTGDRSSQTLRNCTATSCLTGFENTVDCPTLFDNCTVTANSNLATLDGFNISTSGDSYQKLVENCSAVGIASGDIYGFYTNAISCTFRNNTAVGWTYGFTGVVGVGTPTISTAFFNNLARGNTTNYTGIDLNTVSGYWQVDRDSTAPPGGTNEVALSDLTGYWANVADPS